MLDITTWLSGGSLLAQSTGQIVLLALGVFVAFLLAGLLFFFLRYFFDRLLCFLPIFILSDVLIRVIGIPQ